jgi:hypothetical protein
LFNASPVGTAAMLQSQANQSLLSGFHALYTARLGLWLDFGWILTDESSFQPLQSAPAARSNLPGRLAYSSTPL